jgi:parallel beta-helix repeat protein
MLTLAFNIQPAKAGGTITIKADGSIDPLTAPIRRDGDVYTLTVDISSDADGIVIERDNMILDGADYTVQGAWASEGIGLMGRSNVTIRNVNISAFLYGVYLDSSSNSSVSGNTITNSYFSVYLDSSSNNSIGGNNITDDIDGVCLHSSSSNSVNGNYIANDGAGIYHNVHGVYLYSSSNNSISGNDITANSWDGIRLEGYSDNNSISGNNITNNGIGITLYGSSDNKIYHNNFIINQHQVASAGSINVWDDSYPSGGNYWSDYNGSDANHDGIGDTPYVIDANNKDNYPLMPPPVPGDINGDSRVNLEDLVLLALAYGSKPGDPNWNRYADIDGDNIVGLSDLAILAQHYGQHNP